MKLNEPQYIGDGVYITPWDDQGAGGVMITTGHHLSAQADNTVFLEPAVLRSLLKLVEPEEKESAS